MEASISGNLIFAARNLHSIEPFRANLSLVDGQRAIPKTEATLQTSARISPPYAVVTTNRLASVGKHLATRQDLFCQATFGMTSELLPLTWI